MSRIARAVEVGFPHHVVQRGNNKGNIFFDERDYINYFLLLGKYNKKWNLIILAYCLMTNHVHLLIKPPSKISLFKMMQGVSQGYAKYINKKYARSGRLWKSRYYSCIVDSDIHLWRAVRYIERNPTQANMVAHAEDYPYSSARAHINGEEDPFLGETLFEEEQRANYVSFMRENIPDEESRAIEYSTTTGRPFGTKPFIESMEIRLDRKLTPLIPGRRIR